MKRRFKDAPAWADYVYQIVEWFDYKAHAVIGNLTYWRIEFMDKRCNCDKCIKRRG
jgi:hypothetical protein